MTIPSTLRKKKSFLPKIRRIHAMIRKATKHCRNCRRALYTSKRPWVLWRIQNWGWMYTVNMGDGWREGCKWREGTWGEDDGGAQAAPSSCNHTVVNPQSLHSGFQLGSCLREDVPVPLILGRGEKYFSLTERDRDVGKPTPGHSTGQEQAGLCGSQYIIGEWQ